MFGWSVLDPDGGLASFVPSQDKAVFSRTITLKDVWAKIEGKRETT